jgi:predicted PurR-regulated permease PerM
MNTPSQNNQELAELVASRMLEVLIRAGLIAILVALSLEIVAPFFSMMVWALILAVALYPLHQMLARKMGGRQKLAAVVIVILGATVIVVPTALLLNSLADSVRGLVSDVQNNTLKIGAPAESVKKWPIVGERVFSVWTSAHDDLPALVHSLQPKIGDLAEKALGMVAKFGGGILLFLASFIISGIIMGFGESAARAFRAIVIRLAGPERGGALATLCAATIRAVAQGVIGVAFIQASLIGLVLLIAGVPWAGVIAIITLVLGIAQVPAVIVTLPAIGYIWWSGDYSTGMATTYTIVLVLAGMADNVLKPLMLGRGVDSPMPVILLGALGGMASGGISGMFVGATLLAVGYQIFMGWVASNPDNEAAAPKNQAGDSKPTT